MSLTEEHAVDLYILRRVP